METKNNPPAEPNRPKSEIESFLEEVEKMVAADRPWYYDHGGYHRHVSIYDGEVELLERMKKLYDSKYKK